MLVLKLGTKMYSTRLWIFPQLQLLFAAPPRLASMLLCIHATPYKVNVKYVHGSDVKMGDVLSRVNPRNAWPIRGLGLSAREVHNMHLNVSPTLIDCGNSHGNIERQHPACAMWYPITRLAREKTALSAALGALEFSRRTECWRRTVTDRSTHYLAKVPTCRSTRTYPLCTPRCSKMQASCKGSGVLVWYQSWHRQNGKSCAPCQADQVDNTKYTLIPHDVPKRTCPL